MSITNWLPIVDAPKDRVILTDRGTAKFAEKTYGNDSGWYLSTTSGNIPVCLDDGIATSQIHPEYWMDLPPNPIINLTTRVLPVNDTTSNLSEFVCFYTTDLARMLNEKYVDREIVSDQTVTSMTHDIGSIFAEMNANGKHLITHDGMEIVNGRAVSRMNASGRIDIEFFTRMDKRYPYKETPNSMPLGYYGSVDMYLIMDDKPALDFVFGSGIADYIRITPYDVPLSVYNAYYELISEAIRRTQFLGQKYF